MTAYQQGITQYSIGPGDGVTVWSASTVVGGNGLLSASQALALKRVRGEAGSPFEVSGFFSAAPGTFEIDVQVADEDIDTHYQTVANGNITSVDSTNQTFHFDGSTVYGKFVRLLMRTLTNSVTVTATIRR